jgi:tetratricopeptide (TPR) repeat protein
MIFFAVFAQEGTAMNKAEALDLLNEANQNFDQEKYAEAIALYESITEEFTSVQLEHNLGLAYFYNGELAKSIVHMERALKLRPGSVRIKRNLRLLNENVESEITKVPTFFLKSWFNAISNLMTAFAWMILHLLLMVLGAILLFQYLIKGLDFGLHFYYIRGLIIGLFVLSLLFLAFGYGRNSWANSNDAGIIKSNNTILRVAAEENSQEVEKVNEGVKVFIQDEINNFYKIKLEDYTEAWVLKSEIERI